MNSSDIIINNRITLKNKTFELYIPESKIVKAISDMAKKIVDDMKGKNPLFVGILNGAFMFVSELMSKMPPTCELTFAAYSSYQGTKSAGIVQELLPVRGNKHGRPIILLEDIIDTGLTMQYITNRLHSEGVEDVRFATMLLKSGSLQCDLRPNYVGMEIASDFIIGFGLDYDGLGRTSRNIYKIVEEN
jgi:hypoxanthine phosphoribosyltransferase